MNTGNNDENIFMIINHTESNSDDDESNDHYKTPKNKSLALDLVEPEHETVVVDVVVDVVEDVVEEVVEPEPELEPETVVEEVVEPDVVEEVSEEPQNTNQDTNIMSIPKIIFVVPYRDREHQLSFFDDHMRNRVLVDYQKGEYLILYSHQMDTRDFNRGAMKNIGFIAGKNMFPDHYKDITFVFNDVDTMPYVKNFLNYQTTKGNVKHFYGYEFALGGIVSITGEDFEKTNGYPNLFAWSCEDNELQRRVLRVGLRIDRSQFYPIMDKHILQNKDGLIRVANRTEHERIIHGTNEGMSDILEKGDLKYEYNSETGFVNVLNFSVRFEKDSSADKVHDVRKGTKVFEYVPLNMVRNSNLKKAKYWGISKLNMKLG